MLHTLSYTVCIMSDAKVIVRVDPSLKQLCERIAAARRVNETLSQVLRRAMREYVEANKQLELPRARKR